MLKGSTGTSMIIERRPISSKTKSCTNCKFYSSGWCKGFNITCSSTSNAKVCSKYTSKAKKKSSGKKVNKQTSKKKK